MRQIEISHEDIQCIVSNNKNVTFVFEHNLKVRPFHNGPSLLEVNKVVIIYCCAL